ncbi:hypothetical protein HanPI659440_Chr17g0670121 [Helianthus annuus]|nr:hypothetical protein HanPI659440_Chr17g0670121 [Helianthus annuus]
MTVTSATRILNLGRTLLFCFLCRSATQIALQPTQFQPSQLQVECWSVKKGFRSTSVI